MAQGQGPLRGIKVLDITQFQHGPSATRTLSDYGADVLRLENPKGGDPMRGHAFGGEPKAFNYPFETLNRGKRSLTLDLKKPQSLEVMKRLVQWADVVVENFRGPGVMEGWGCGYDTMREWKPDIIYCSASGFGPHGPRAGDGSYDAISQAFTGAMVGNGGGPSHEPLLAPWAMADEVGAMNLTQGILMALVHKARTGEGQRLLTSQTGAMVQFQGTELGRFVTTGAQKNEGFTYRRVHQAQMQHCGSEGKYFIFTCMLDKQWKGLCTVVGRMDLFTDERSKTMATRRGHKQWVKDELAPIFATRPREHWIDALQKMNVPVAPCNSYADVVKEPQLWANNYLAKIQHPKHGEVTVFGKALEFSASPANTTPGIAPGLGEHTEETMRQLGFDHDEVEKLAQEGVVSMPPRQLASKL